MIKKYKKKPIIIEAIQWVGGEENEKEIKNFVTTNIEFVGIPSHRIVIRTLEGDMICDFVNYIIKGVRGEFYPCEKSIFEETYEER